MNLEELGIMTDSEYDKEHSCEENIFPEEIRLIHCVSTNNQPQDAWGLHYLHYADEKEVEMGEAEYVNEVTSYHMFVVSYCPYCGVNLNAI